jgi:EmrB/QacA subfamily drug resistance transporter
MAGYNAAQTQPENEGRFAYKWRVLISVIFGIFMIILDTTVVNVALRTIQSGYGVGLQDVQWVISIYVLALGITTPLSGFLADRFGLKRIYVAGLALFVFGSFLCGIAPGVSDSIWLLVVARAIQGIGGGMAQPLAAAFIYGTFPPNELGTALGYFGIALVVGPALGPILGGWLVDLNLWQWIFFINVPIGVLGVILAGRWLRERRPSRTPKSDPLGLVTAVIGFGAVLLAASEVSELGWGSSRVVTLFIVGGVSLVLFALVELFVAKEPLLDLRLFKRPTFLTASLIGYVSVLALFGAEFLMPLYLQVLRGRSALETGLILLPLAIAAAIATPIAGRLYDKIGPRMLVIVGFGLLLINTWQLAQIQADTAIGWIVFLLALRGLALGMTVQTTFAAALGAVPRENLARGSSLINGTRFVVQSIGVAILATVLSGSLVVARELQEQQLAAQPASATEATQSAAPVPTHFGLCETPGVAADQNVPQGISGSAAEQVRGQIQTACNEYVVGFERTYNLTFYAALVALILGAFLPGWPFRWAGRTVGGDAPAPAH